MAAAPMKKKKLTPFFPFSSPQAEVRACVQKKGGGLTADLRELNFVLDV